MKIHSVKVKPEIKCDKCSKIYKYQSYLARHQKTCKGIVEIPIYRFIKHVHVDHCYAKKPPHKITIGKGCKYFVP